MSCGHRCYLTCHSGNCGDTVMCKKKVKILCPCKRRKKEVGCKEWKDLVKLECDEECVEIKSKSRGNEVSKGDKRRELKEKLAREEAEKFEKLMAEGRHTNETSRASQHSRKRKNRRRTSQDIEPSFIQKHKILISIVITAFISILTGAFLIRN